MEQNSKNNTPNWIQQFDKHWTVDAWGLGDWAERSEGGNPFYDNDKIKAFIHQNRKELVEEILADIPDNSQFGYYNFVELKNKLRDKYLNN